MPFDHTLNVNWNSEGASLSSKIVESFDGEDNRSVAVTDGSTDQQIDWQMIRADAKVLYMVADQDLTVKTNDSGTPDDTINLKAGEPIVWWVGSQFALTDLFSADVTELYVSNSSGSDATLDIRLLFDA